MVVRSSCAGYGFGAKGYPGLPLIFFVILSTIDLAEIYMYKRGKYVYTYVKENVVYIYTYIYGHIYLCMYTGNVWDPEW